MSMIVLHTSIQESGTIGTKHHSKELEKLDRNKSLTNLVLAFPEQLPLAHVVHANQPADRDQNLASKSADRRWDLFNRRFVQELQFCAVMQHPE